jgi:hypothetical protein
MSEDYPVPPPELVEQWIAEIWHAGTPVRVAASDLHIATQAAQWGADQKRRSKLPSLKEQALADLDTLVGRGRSSDTIRRALEALDD